MGKKIRDVEKAVLEDRTANEAVNRTIILPVVVQDCETW
jgi:hypothetical protein